MKNNIIIVKAKLSDLHISSMISFDLRNNYKY